jgi:hypothetical protein
MPRGSNAMKMKINSQKRIFKLLNFLKKYTIKNTSDMPVNRKMIFFIASVFSAAHSIETKA